MTQISVAGTAVKSLRPERGIVTVDIRQQWDDRAAAVAAATATHAAIAAEATAHVSRGAATWSSAEPVWATTYSEYVKDSDIREIKHRAGSTIRVKFQDFGALAQWLAEIALRGDVTTSVRWALTDKTRAAAEDEVRVEALGDAIARASSYATALGSRKPELLAIFEPGLRPNVSEPGGMYGVAGRAGATYGSAPAAEVKPDDITVSSSVTADFVV